MKNQQKNHSILKVTILSFYLSVFLEPCILFAQNTESQNVEQTEQSQEELNQALLAAVNNGNIEGVKELIARGADIEAKDMFGASPLALSVMEGHTDIAAMLIDKGADTNITVPVIMGGATLLGWANMREDTEMIVLLTEVMERDTMQTSTENEPEAESPENAPDSNTASSRDAEENIVALNQAFFNAIRSGSEDEVKELIKQGVDVNNENENGQTALQLAVICNNKEIAELLIDQGADIDATGQPVNTPLFFAMMNSNEDMVSLLLSKGADVNMKVGLGIVNRSPLRFATQIEDFDIITLLLNNGAKFDVKDNRGWTDLHYAARDASKDTIEFFISKIVDTSNIYMAAFAGDLDHIQELIEQGIEVDIKDEAGWTTLFWAASAGQTEVAEFLINSGADVNVKITAAITGLRGRGSSSDRGITPLHQAAKIGKLGLAELLISNGADINANDPSGYAPLYYAASGGHLEIVKLLVSQGAYVNLENQDNPLLRGSTMQPLYSAVLGGHKDVVEYLIDNGAETNIQILGGRTLLDIAQQGDYSEIAELLSQHGVKETLSNAVSSNNIEQAKLLISQGADVNAEGLMGRPILLQVIMTNNLEMADLLISAGADLHARTEQNGFTPLHYMASIGNRAGAEYLLSKGVDIQAGNRWGATPLHVAVSNNRPEVVKLLLEKGADVNARTGYTQSPVLHEAVGNGQKEMVDLLLANGADIQARFHGITVLNYAMIQNQDDLIRYLNEKGLNTTTLHLGAYFGEMQEVEANILDGADINTKDDSGFSPLHTAVCGGKSDIVKFLIENNANVNARDFSDSTPLHFAVSKGREEIVSLLISGGADVNLRDFCGRNSLYLAAYHGHKIIAELLISKGADVNVRHSENYTPLHVASMNGHQDVVELLLENGADINAKNEDGDTPLSLTQSPSQNRPLGAQNYTAVIQFLQDYQYSLIRRELPQLSDLGIDISQADIKGGKILVCFFDMEQRPSRNCINQLSERAEQLKQQNITIIAVQASEIEQETFNNWIQENNLPFSAGILPGNTEEKLSNWGIEAMPWLILTDAEHIVIAEEFNINELDEKIALTE